MDEALAVIEHPSPVEDKTWLLTVYVPAARFIAAEVRRLRGTLKLREDNDAWWREQRDIWQTQLAEVEADLAALRQRHAEAVEKAFKEGYEQGSSDMNTAHHAGPDPDSGEAWLASEARKAVARDE